MQTGAMQQVPLQIARRVMAVVKFLRGMVKGEVQPGGLGAYGSFIHTT